MLNEFEYMKTYKSCPKCGAVLKVDSDYVGRINCSKCHAISDASEFKSVPSITVMCPKCNTRLVSYNIGGNVGVKCRNCSYVGSLAEFKAYTDSCNANSAALNNNNPVVDDAPESTRLNIPGAGSRGKTEVNIPSGYTSPLALLLLEDNDNKWDGAERCVPLKRGRTIVGRRGGKADIELPTQDMFMGRAHFVVDVSYNAASATFRHTLSDNSSVNGTLYKAKNGEWIKLDNMTVVVIKDGDLIKVGHTVLKVTRGSENTTF